MGGKSSKGRGFRGVLSQNLDGHKDAVLCCAFSPDGKLLATCSSDKTIIIWDMKSFTARSHLKAHTAEVTAVSFSPDSTMLISSGRDTRVILWDAKAGEILQKSKKHRGPVLHCAYSPDDNLLFATASDDHTVGLWNIQASRMDFREADWAQKYRISSLFFPRQSHSCFLFQR